MASLKQQPIYFLKILAFLFNHLIFINLFANPAIDSDEVIIDEFLKFELVSPSAFGKSPEQGIDLKDSDFSSAYLNSSTKRKLYAKNHKLAKAETLPSLHKVLRDVIFHKIENKDVTDVEKLYRENVGTILQYYINSASKDLKKIFQAFMKELYQEIVLEYSNAVKKHANNIELWPKELEDFIYSPNGAYHKFIKTYEEKFLLFKKGQTKSEKINEPSGQQPVIGPVKNFTDKIFEAYKGNDKQTITEVLRLSGAFVGSLVGLSVGYNYSKKASKENLFENTLQTGEFGFTGSFNLCLLDLFCKNKDSLSPKTLFSQVITDLIEMKKQNKFLCYSFTLSNPSSHDGLKKEFPEIFSYLISKQKEFNESATPFIKIPDKYSEQLQPLTRVSSAVLVFEQPELQKPANKFQAVLTSSSSEVWTSCDLLAQIINLIVTQNMSADLLWREFDKTKSFKETLAKFKANLLKVLVTSLDDVDYFDATYLKQYFYYVFSIFNTLYKKNNSWESVADVFDLPYDKLVKSFSSKFDLSVETVSKKILPYLDANEKQLFFGNCSNPGQLLTKVFAILLSTSSDSIQNYFKQVFAQLCYLDPNRDISCAVAAQILGASFGIHNFPKSWIDNLFGIKKFDHQHNYNLYNQSSSIVINALKINN